MRKDNYMISLVNTGVFRIKSPCFGEHSGKPSIRARRTFHLMRFRWFALVSGVFGKSLEWNLRFCVLDSMFDEKFSVRGFLDPSSAESFSENLQLDEGISKLKRRSEFSACIQLSPKSASSFPSLTWNSLCRFIIMGIINFVLMPFIAIFMAIFFILKVGFLNTLCEFSFTET